MKKTNTIVISFCLLLWSTTEMKAQQGPSVSGGDANGAGGKVSYTVGQTDYINTTSNGGAITEGLQQPYKIAVLAGIEETSVNLTCAVSPNPTTDFVVLNVQKNDVQNMSYRLLDAQGKLITHQSLSGSNTTIPMSGYPNALYLIQVFDNNNKEIKSFKIIKNK